MILGDEHVTVRSSLDFTRIVKTFGVSLYFEAFRGLRPCIVRFGNYLWGIRDTLRGIRLGQIGRSDPASNAGLLVFVADERLLAGDDILDVRSIRVGERAPRKGIN